MSKVRAQRGLTILDYSLILLGGFDNFVDLLKTNSIGIDDELPEEIEYDESKFQAPVPGVGLSTAKRPTTTKIQSFDGQSIFDVSLQGYSGFDNIVQFAKDAGLNSISTPRIPIARYTFDNNQNNDLSLKTIIDRKGYVFSSGTEDVDYRITEEEEQRITEDGYIRIIE